MLFSSVSVSSAQDVGGGVNVPGTWWLGEGLKQGDQFSYKLCHVVYKECQYFEIHLWIMGDKQVGSEQKWLAKTVVYDGHKIIKGEMELGKVTAEPTGGSKNLATYTGAFKSSISWLSSFATSYEKQNEKGPKAFDIPSWGKIANIGGQQVKPLSVESVTVPAGTFEDAIKIGWRTGGVDSFIWILDEFPFPVKANTWTHVSEGKPPQEYEFKLLSYDENILSDPFVDIVQSVAPQQVLGCPNLDNVEYTSRKITTDNFSYGVEILYRPEQPKQGCDLEWLIKFRNIYDETDYLYQVQYDIVVVDDPNNLGLIRSLAAEENKKFLYSPSGLTERAMVVKEPVGLNNYLILIYGLAPEFIVPDPRVTPSDYTIVQINVKPNDEYEVPKNPVIRPVPPTSSPGDDDDDDDADAVDTSDTKIPSWVKNNAAWWSDGIIDDDTFVNGLQHLIMQKIIIIPDTQQGAGSSDTKIPSWVKNNAALWSDGIIDDDAFIMGLQYLITRGIITISS